MFLFFFVLLNTVTLLRYFVSCDDILPPAPIEIRFYSVSIISNQLHHTIHQQIISFLFFAIFSLRDIFQIYILCFDWKMWHTSTAVLTAVMYSRLITLPIEFIMLNSAVQWRSWSIIFLLLCYCCLSFLWSFSHILIKSGFNTHQILVAFLTQFDSK